MTGIRIAWVVLAVATGILGSATAQWPLYEITNCEIGLGPLSSADCYRWIHDYFGRELFLVLALPVALCVIPAVIPRPFVSWIVSATMLCAAVVGFFPLSALVCRLCCRWWGVSLRQCWHWYLLRCIRGSPCRTSAPLRVLAAGFAIRDRVSDQSGLKNSSIEIQNHATIAATERNASTNGNANCLPVRLGIVISPRMTNTAAGAAQLIQ